MTHAILGNAARTAPAAMARECVGSNPLLAPHAAPSFLSVSAHHRGYYFLKMPALLFFGLAARHLFGRVNANYPSIVCKRVLAILLSPLT